MQAVRPQTPGPTAQLGPGRGGEGEERGWLVEPSSSREEVLVSGAGEGHHFLWPGQKETRLREDTGRSVGGGS